MITKINKITTVIKTGTNYFCNCSVIESLDKKFCLKDYLQFFIYFNSFFEQVTKVRFKQ